MRIPAQKSTNNENRTKRKKSASGIEDDAQNKKLPGVMEEGLIIKEEARETELDELWTKVKKIQASTTENALQAKRLLGIAELKSEIDQNLDKVNECLSEFR